MTETLQPQTPDQLLEVIAWANAENATLNVRGFGTKLGLGEAVEASHMLDMSTFSGIVNYEPEELVLTLGSATPMAELENLLAENRQMLAFEPQDWGWALGGESASGTIGGAMMVSSNGPRRFKAGAARDHLLGLKAVSGRGEAFAAGGRVVKNVTGYDLSKLMAGSYGTLAAATELTLKVLPAPEKTYTLLVYGLDVEPAMALMRALANTPYDVSGLAYVAAHTASLSSVSYVRDRQMSVLGARIEGPQISVHHRLQALKEMLTGAQEIDDLRTHNSVAFWQEVRDIKLLPHLAGDVLWRVSAPPSAAASIVAQCQPDHWVADWAGGLIWLHYDRADAGQAEVVRTSVQAGGQAMLVRAPDDLRNAIPVFQPLPQGLATLNRRVKENYDPNGVLNPGRMGV